MRKRTKRKVWAASAGPVASAMHVREWNAGALDAEIQAFMGENSDKVVNAAGRRFFIILGAVDRATDPGTKASPDLDIVQDAAEAVFDQKDDPEVQQERRVRILAGLQAVQRLQHQVAPHDIVQASIELSQRLRQGAIVVGDFLAVMGKAA